MQEQDQLDGEVLTPLFAAVRGRDCMLDTLRLSEVCLNFEECGLLESILYSADLNLITLDFQNCQLKPCSSDHQSIAAAASTADHDDINYDHANYDDDRYCDNDDIHYDDIDDDRNNYLLYDSDENQFNENGDDSEDNGDDSYDDQYDDNGNDSDDNGDDSDDGQYDDNEDDTDDGQYNDTGDDSDDDHCPDPFDDNDDDQYNDNASDGDDDCYEEHCDDNDYANSEEYDDDDYESCDNNSVTGWEVHLCSPKGQTNKLEVLRMCGCLLTIKCCEALASVLSSNSCLRELDLSNNDLQDTGVNRLSLGLSSPLCRLTILSLSRCRVTKEGCSSLASSLKSNPSYLVELNLSYNHPGTQGTQLLLHRLEDSNCKLSKLNVDHDEEYWVNPQLLKDDACDLTLDPNTAYKKLVLSEQSRTGSLSLEQQPYPDHPERFDHRPQVLCREGLTGRCYWEAELRGSVSVGVTYKSIKRKGVDDSVRHNHKSWCFHQNGDWYSVTHDGGSTNLPVPFREDPVHPGVSAKDLPQRVGVYLDWPAGILSFYRVYSNAMVHLHTFHTAFNEPLYPAFQCYAGSSFTLYGKQELNTGPVDFIPILITGPENIEYRFQCPGPGVFRCGLTGLLFGMEGEGEVLYKTVQWDESLLQSAGSIPAGPLFSIECPQGSVCQLHLPHCESLSAPLSEGLSVAHITDDVVSILKPLTINKTHVLVNVTHLSGFGLLRIFEWLFFSPQPISGQVLLFLRPLSQQQWRMLNVFLLPGNVLIPEVRQQHDDDEYIKTSAECDLTHGAHYRLDCDGHRVQPPAARFDQKYGPNYHPKFEVFLGRSDRSATLTLRNQNDSNVVWEREVDLTAAASTQRQALDGTNFSSWISERLLDILRHLRSEDFKTFQWHLINGVLEDFPKIPECSLEGADRQTTVNIMVANYNKRALKITLEILKKIPRNDLLVQLEQDLLNQLMQPVDII